MALVATGMAAWAARRNVLAGVLLGLAVATKFYPLVFFGPLLLLCLRAGRMRAFWVTTGSAALAWLAVDVPVMLAAPAGWRTFYSFSRTRPADWGAIWYFFETRRVPLLGTVNLATLNVLSACAFAIGCLAIAVLALAAPRRPRLPQLFFLALAVFLLTNKVWSPQYVIWLVPLAVLARPRLGAYVLWQIAEVGYFLAIWWYLLTIPGNFHRGDRLPRDRPGLVFHRATRPFRHHGAACRACRRGHPAPRRRCGARWRGGRPGRRCPRRSRGRVRAAPRRAPAR